MPELLTAPLALGRPVSGSSGEYILGSRPKLSMWRDGTLLWDSSHPYGESGTHEAFISRADIEVGIDKIPTSTLYIEGKECAKFVIDTFKRGDTLEFRFAYDDVGEPFSAGSQDRTLFRGEIIQAFPPTGFPPAVQLQIDGASYRMRTLSADTPSDIPEGDPGDYIIERLAEIELAGNFEAQVKNDPNVTQSLGDEGKLIDYLNRWTQANGLHWLDTMENSIGVIFPNGRYTYFGGERKGWILPVQADPEDDAIAPILSVWDIRESYVDTPAKIVVPYLPRGKDVAEMVERTVNDGRPETTYITPLMPFGGKDAADAYADALVQETLWRMVQGNFVASVGLPIMPFDEIAATRGFPGLENYYDVYFLVYRTQLTYDQRGFITRGEVRSVL